jgi:hypothetical protein
LPDNDLQLIIQNPPRIFLNLGHPFCYNQRKRKLNKGIDIRGQLSDISRSELSAISRQLSDIRERKIGEEQVRNLAG